MWQLQISFRVSRRNNAYLGKHLPNKSVKMRLKSHKRVTIMTERVLNNIHRFALTKASGVHTETFLVIVILCWLSTLGTLWCLKVLWKVVPQPTLLKSITMNPIFVDF